MDKEEKLNYGLVNVLTQKAFTMSIFYQDTETVKPTFKEKVKAIAHFKKAQKRTSDVVKERKYVIYPPTFGKLQIMAQYISKMEIDYDLWNTDAEKELWRLCNEHLADVCKFIAVASMNKRQDLINPVAIDREAKFIRDNGKPEDFAKIMVVILKQCDLANFTLAILSTKTYKLKSKSEEKTSRIAQSR